MNKFLVGLLTAGVIGAVVASSACTVSISCLGGTVDCDGICVDTDNDPNDCGACGFACNVNEVCDLGACVSGACTSPPVIGSISATDNGDGTIDSRGPLHRPVR